MNLEGGQWHQRWAEDALQARLWGDFSLAAVGRDVTPRGRKARALLAWLALHPGRPISRERLCGLLWGDRAEEQARASLRQTLLELKTFTTGPQPLLQVSRQSITLDPARLHSDVDALAAAATQGDQVLLARLLPDADEIFLGNLDGVDSGFDDWLAIERTRQRDRLEQRIGAGAAPAPAQNAAPGPAATDPPRTAPAPSRVPRALIVLLVVALAIAGSIGFVWSQRSATAPLAIAVLPFSDLSGTDKPYLAEGISEEILNRLAGNPRLKVLGRTSAAALRGKVLDAGEIGRRLGVAYLVEGSVRTAGPQLRVVVALVRSEDGARLWSKRYDGKMADIFAIQDQIGDSVASRLQLPAGARPEALLTAEAETYARYLQARTMLKDLNPGRIDPAIALLRQVLQFDPGFAAAWAELGAGYALQSYFSQQAGAGNVAVQQARAAATRALALNPRLARAHLVLGTTAATKSEGRSHLEMAVQLDPHAAENWFFLHEAAVFDGDFPAALNFVRRAVAIDPLWWPAFLEASSLAWDMGHREEAEAYSRRVEEGAQPRFDAIMARSDMAWRRGDFSLAFQIGQQAWLVAPPERRYFAELCMSRALRAVGRYEQAIPIWHRYPVDADMMGMWKGKAPGPAATAAFIADAAATWNHEARIHFLLNTLWAAGRAAEIVRLFDARFASADAMQTALGPNPRFVALAVPVAISLRAVGRSRDGDRLLGLATTAMQRMTARGPLPIQYLGIQASLAAATGQRDAAIAVLQTAHDRGFIYSAYYRNFSDLAQEPAFAAIRNDPRFQRIRSALLAHQSREARQLAQITVNPRLAARFVTASAAN